MPPGSVYKPVCLICLADIPGFGSQEQLGCSDKELVTTQLKQFIQFSKHYLKIPVDLNRMLKLEGSGVLEKGMKRPLFCGECQVDVEDVLEVWKELCKWRMRMICKLKDLGTIIKRAEMGNVRLRLKTLTKQLDIGQGSVAHLRVQWFRRLVAENCKQCSNLNF